MSKVSVVIPFFQREAGLLRRALQSIYDQVLRSGVTIEVIVVDDQSPRSPETETEGLVRDDFSVRIVKRLNGGPAAARNSGLAVAHGDYIAFLDSDDWWLPHHLAVGLAALDTGAEFYFANNYYDGDQTWFDCLKCKDNLIVAASPMGNGAYCIARDTLMPFLLEECIAHTSTVIFDARAIGELRFDEKQATAGEDHLFWLSATVRSKHAVFSVAPMTHRGRGLDLYRGASDWNSPECVRRLYYNLVVHKKLLARFCRTGGEKDNARHHINLIRHEILYLFVRNALAHVRTNSWVAAQLLGNDPGFWLTLPANALAILYQRLFGELEFVRK